VGERASRRVAGEDVVMVEGGRTEQWFEFRSGGEGGRVSGGDAREG